VQLGRSKHTLPNFQSILDQFPDDVASQLADQISSLYDVWFRCLAVIQHTGRPYSSSSSNSQNLASNFTYPGFQTENGTNRSSNEEDGSSPPGNGENGDGDQSTTSALLSGLSKKAWACPFYQRNPYHYCMERELGDYRRCAYKCGFSEVHFVK
jgi:hypothetical protein